MRIFLLGAFFVALSFTSLTALQIHSFDPDLHQRFVDGSFPANPEETEDLWAAEKNFAGVGWSASDLRKGFTLISPKHFLLVNHFRPSVGSKIEFQSLDGTVHSFTYAGYHSIYNSKSEKTDIVVGELTEAIPASLEIPIYPLYGGADSDLVGEDIYVYGWGADGPRIGKGKIDNFYSLIPPGAGIKDVRHFTFTYKGVLADQGDAYCEVGDSGSPSFVAVDGTLAVVGLHMLIQGVGSMVKTYDGAVGAYLDQIEAILAMEGYRPMTVPQDSYEFSFGDVAYVDDEIVVDVTNPARFFFEIEEMVDLENRAWGVIGGDHQTGLISIEASELADRQLWRLRRYPFAFDRN